MKYLNEERTEELVGEIKTRLGTKEPLVFKGTTAEWNALSAEEQAGYSVKIITDDGDTGDISQYVNDQLELSDWESIVLSTDSSSPTTIPYDGFVSIKDEYSGNAGYTRVFVDGTNIIQLNQYGAFGNSAQSPDGLSFPVKKGQNIYLETDSVKNIFRFAAYYKKRDYSKRGD